MSHKKDISLKNEIGFQAINKGANMVGDKIAEAVPKPTSTGGKLLWHLGAMLVGYGLTKALKNDKGELDEGDRRFVSGVQRSLHRKV